jgi:hypothetical protein
MFWRTIRTAAAAGITALRKTARSATLACAAARAKTIVAAPEEDRPLTSPATRAVSATATASSAHRANRARGAAAHASATAEQLALPVRRVVKRRRGVSISRATPPIAAAAGTPARPVSRVCQGHAGVTRIPTATAVPRASVIRACAPAARRRAPPGSAASRAAPAARNRHSAPGYFFQ